MSEYLELLVPSMGHQVEFEQAIDRQFYFSHKISWTCKSCRNSHHFSNGKRDQLNAMHNICGRKRPEASSEIWTVMHHVELLHIQFNFIKKLHNKG